MIIYPLSNKMLVQITYLISGKMLEDGMFGGII